MKNNQPDKDSLEMMVRARICTVIKKTGRFTWGAIVVGMAIILVAALVVSSHQLLVIGAIISGIGIGGSMTLDLILVQFKEGGTFEPDQSEQNEK